MDTNNTVVGTIESIKISNNRGVIRLQDGQSLSWFQQDKRGQMSPPQASFMNNRVMEGQTWAISYYERQGADGRVWRNVSGFTPVPPGTQVTPPAPPQMQSQQNNQQAPQYSRVEDEAIGKTACTFIAQIFNGVAPEKIPATITAVRTHMDQFIMLAELLVANSKGERRQFIRNNNQPQIAAVPTQTAFRPEQASPADLAGPWDNEMESEDDRQQSWR